MIFTVLLSSPAVADDDRKDHELARQAVERGELLPLSRILALVERAYPGRVLDVELERKDGRFWYEIEVLLSDGRVIELSYDGRDGRLIKSEVDDED
jgi:uncharacterized membrane protein YkoI